MIVIHIYKANCFEASRVLLQFSWLNCQTFFLHRSDQLGQVDVDDERSVTSALLSLREIWRMAYGHKVEKICWIFHAQSSLIYLYFLVMLRLIFRARNFEVVYDVHDLNEWPEEKNFRSSLRYLVLYFLEFFASRFRIAITTVSKGLARIYFKRFRRSPSVIYNVTFEVNRENIYELNEKFNNDRRDIVYFGLVEPERLPVSLVQDFLNNDKTSNFDIYGRAPKGVAINYIEHLLKFVANDRMRFLGPYKPSAMGFLKKYRFSWMCFESDRLNIRYCMPNKLFQSLSAGLCCVVSDSLIEARALFGDACLSYHDFITMSENNDYSLVNEIIWSEVDDRLKRVAYFSRDTFIKVCIGKTI